jgi:hypothetical protein
MSVSRIGANTQAYPFVKSAIISHCLAVLPVLIFAIMILYSNAQADNYHQWVDNDGVTHISNYPVDNSRQKSGKIIGAQPDKQTETPSDAKKFVAKSREWLKSGIKDIATTVEITHEKNNIYNVNISSSKEVKPFSAVEPDDVVFFSFCVADYFASQKGFNGWEMLKDNKKENKESRDRKGIKYSIALAKP